MDIICFENYSFTYPGRDKAALSGLTLSVKRGEYLLLAGQSGSGKSTLLRHFCPQLAPHGAGAGVFRRGSVKVGYVMQNPDSQLVTDKVWHELAFGLEHMGLSGEAVRLRVAEVAEYFGISGWLHRDTDTLSGGQKQRLVLAAVMATDPEALVLDEPAAQLDPIAAGELFAVLRRLHHDMGLTVVLSEHRLEDVAADAERLVVLEGGRVIADGAVREAASGLFGHEMFSAVPVPVRVFMGCGGAGRVPLTIREGRDWLAGQETLSPPEKEAGQPTLSPQKPLLDARGLYFRYGKSAPDVLCDASLALYPGVSALLGGNGSGKSTFLKLLSGAKKPYAGRVRCAGRVGLLPQEPALLFTRDSVREVLGGELPGEVEALCRLGGLLDMHPYDLSGGEQQRLALGLLLMREPEVILLDEPTKGLDAPCKAELGRMLRRLAEGGRAVLVVSHDVEFCAGYADRCHLLFDGRVVAGAETVRFFGGNRFYTTAAVRMSRGIVEGAVTSASLCSAIKN